MENATKMISTHSRWLLVTCLASSLLAGCSSDDPVPAGTGGTPSGGSASGGSSGGPSNAGTSSGGNAQGGTNPIPAAGTGGSSAQAGTTSGGSATGGSNAGGSATGGSGGSATGGGSGGSATGGSGGGTGEPTAVATITGLNGNAVTGTATFTQGATMTKLVLTLTACPNGDHASHLHENKDCGNNGMAAGGHWLPNGEGITQYTCTNNTGSIEFSKPTSQWTVGGAAATDVTQFSFMVHEGATGPRIGCGLVNKQ